MIPKAAARPLHRHPPFTVAGVLLRNRWVAAVVAALFVALAVAARIQGGGLLLSWDRPVQFAVEEHLRRPGLTTGVRALSQLGGLTVVVVGSAVLLLLAYRRCRPLASVLLVASTARPLLEFVLKEAADRARPDLGRLVPGNGPSFPSGHVMAAVALWGMLPAVVTLMTNRRLWWWLSVVTSGLVVTGVAFSRVYLGVHWFSDVVGALLIGYLYLAALEWLLVRRHRRSPCPALTDAGVTSRPPAGGSRRRPC